MRLCASSKGIFAMVLAGLFVAGGAAFSAARVAFGAVMQSPSYRIQSDSINFGGVPSSGASYNLRDTLGEVATGESQSGTYRMHAGFQQMQEIYLAMSAANDITLAPALGSVTGGISNGTTSVTVKTDNPAGYLLQISAEQSPAMVRVGGGGSIDDYPTNTPLDPTFSIPAQRAVFGLSADGVDVAADFLYNGASCGSGSDAAATCWTGLSTTTRTIAQRPNANHPAGTQTTLHFRVGIAANAMTPTGVYHATTTLTLLPR
ncbi:MAG: hypothetical protein KatS3mg099_322 [Candidatus Parcubacteria bacterium]|nr:MAG: hypothetical protein KatS3mg099_322 [Candidatus Parcubacteria bacterium]